MNQKLIKSAVAAYKKKLDSSDIARLEFFEGIWEIQARAYEVAKDFEWNAPSDSDLTKLLKQGSPVFLKFAAPVDKELFVATFDELIGYYATSGVFEPELISALKSRRIERVVNAGDFSLAGKSPALWLEELQSLFIDDGLNKDFAHAATIVAAMAIKPLLEPFADIVSAQIKKLGDKIKSDKPTLCPVCGCLPGMAHVGGQTSSSGRGRLLVCSQCGATWEYERVRCARCGTKNQTSLHFFNIDGDDSHRIATCDECGDYIKTTYSEDALLPVSYPVEEVVMARLDAIAMDPSIAGGDE